MATPGFRLSVRRRPVVAAEAGRDGIEPRPVADIEPLLRNTIEASPSAALLRLIGGGAAIVAPDLLPIASHYRWRQALECFGDVKGSGQVYACRPQAGPIRFTPRPK